LTSKPKASSLNPEALNPKPSPPALESETPHLAPPALTDPETTRYKCLPPAPPCSL